MALTGYETLVFEKMGPVAHIALNRPHVRNAFNIQMRDDLSEALAAVEGDDEVGALVISGEGQAFCAGADLTEFGTAPSQVAARQVRWQRDVWGQLDALAIPAVAALHGYCIGSGVEIALFCDLRVATVDTIFAMPETHLGMIPAAGGSQTLPRQCGAAHAMDLLLTGRRIGVEQAQKMGLVTRVVPSGQQLPEAMILAQDLAARPRPEAVYVKRAIRQGMGLGLPAGLELEARLAQMALA